MRCNYCDYKVNEDTIICPNCGEDVHTTKKNVIKENKLKEEKENPKIHIDGDYSVLFGLLGFASHSIISDAIVSVIGACLVVYLYRRFMK